MKQNIFVYKKILLVATLFTLCLILILTMFGCKKNNENVEEPPTVDPITVFSNGSSAYTIVRADNASEVITKAASDLYFAFDSNAGISIPVRDEYGYNNGEKTPAIIIGVTADEVSARLFSEMLYDDYLVHVENGNIYLCGGSDGATVNAVKYFIDTYLADSKAELTLNGDLDLRYSHEYSAKALSVDGHPISEYRIVYDADLTYSKLLAEDVGTLITSKCGLVLDIVSDNEAEVEREILVGVTNRSQSIDEVKNFSSPNRFYNLKVVGSKLLVVNQGVRSGEVALDELQKILNSLNVNDCNLTSEKVNVSGDIKNSTDKKAMDRVEGTDIRVMQNNVLRAVYANEYQTDYTEQQRAELLADTYLMYLPDVIILNEMINGMELPAMLPTLLSEYYEFTDAEYLGLYEDPEKGSGLHYQNLKDRKYATLIAYRKGAGLTEIESGFSYLSNMISYHGVSWTVFEKSDGNRFLAVSAHLSNNKNTDGTYGTTYTDDLLKIINVARTKYGDLPVIVAGDFFFYNAPNCAPYNLIIESGFADVSETADNKHSEGIGTSHALGEGSQGGYSTEVDMIFVSADWFVPLSHKIIISVGTVNGSDHYPVLSDIKFSKSATKDDIPYFDDGTGDLIVKDEDQGGSGVWGSDAFGTN